MYSRRTAIVLSWSLCCFGVCYKSIICTEIYTPYIYMRLHLGAVQHQKQNPSGKTLELFHQLCNHCFQFLTVDWTEFFVISLFLHALHYLGSFLLLQELSCFIVLRRKKISFLCQPVGGRHYYCTPHQRRDKAGRRHSTVETMSPQWCKQTSKTLNWDCKLRTDSEKWENQHLKYKQQRLQILFFTVLGW